MSTCKESHVNLPCVAKEAHSNDQVDRILNQSDFLSHDQAQMLGQELNLAAEMSEGEYSHLQHLIQTHMETNQSAIPDQNLVMVNDTSAVSPMSTTQAIDLSTSSDGHDMVLPGEKTPTCYGEVPGFVLDKIRGEDSLTALPDSTFLRGPCSARVCLEKRFDTVAGSSMGPEDLQSALLSKSLTIVQQLTQTQGASNNPQLLSKWIRTEGRTQMPASYIGFLKPVNKICGTVIGQVSHLEPKLQESFVIPLNLCSEKVLTDISYPRVNNISENGNMSFLAPNKDQQNKSKASIETPDSAGDSESSVKKRPEKTASSSLRRQKHNSKERERRRRIRLCCDELNLLVPFCQTDTDKVTTLQWTSAYLRFINKTYGDKIKEEFWKTFTDKDGQEPNPSAVSNLILQNTERIPRAAEP